ncbi:hypothetical protein QR692_10050 [Lactococcus petauri]|uniref:hypothetical protein n=1 Tax=Lactococcus petauri TaxID=1940789 RepID=UPI002078BB9A|nr:hypothetical protein [Lactococcus petauri]USI65324.1 hypothetical protein LMK05_10935 [Lactococcus petauri]USI67819.1 hypothetical protein LMK04_10170 [Lactococcus petauri]WJE12480.1 hypothetical protein QR692_10050 [Lactococcus petauri]
MKTITLETPLSSHIYHGARGLLHKGEVSDLFMKDLQSALKDSEFAFEFIQTTNSVVKEQREVPELSMDTTHTLDFLERFVKEVLAYRKKNKSEIPLSCLVLYPSLLEGDFGFYKEVYRLFHQEGLFLDTFAMSCSEYEHASREHAYLASSDIIIECRAISSSVISESQTYKLGRLNDALLVNVQTIGRRDISDVTYRYVYKDFKEVALDVTGLKRTVSAYLKNREQETTLPKRTSEWFYNNWKNLLKEWVCPESYYHYHLYQTQPFVLEETLASYDVTQKVKALGQIQDSHLPFITAALNAVQFGQMITFADSTREEGEGNNTSQEERTVVKPALAYESFGQDGKAHFHL